jgi:hypothetical protein
MRTAEAGEIIGWGTPEAQWVAPYAECARTQRDACHHVADLVAAGCMERDIQGMPAQYDAAPPTTTEQPVHDLPSIR